MKDPFKIALTHFSNKSQYVYPLAIVFSVVKTYDALRSTEISLEVAQKLSFVVVVVVVFFFFFMYTASDDFLCRCLFIYLFFIFLFFQLS